MLDKEEPHSQCMSLRLDPKTLKEIDKERQGKTLSAMMNAQIKNTIKLLVEYAKNGENSD